MNSDLYYKLSEREANLSKYFNTKTIVDGITFDSKKEARRYEELRLLIKGKAIKDLEIHPRFILLEGFTWKDKKYQGISYEADFKYLEKQEVVGHQKWVEVIEDVKGIRTEVYKLKKKLFLSKYQPKEFREL